MSKNINTTSDDVKASVSSLYGELLEKRKMEREAKEEAKRKAKEEAKAAKKAAKEAGETEDEKEIKMSKKERREKEFDSWKEVMIGLTGDDLEYTTEKKRKKKYKKWIDDDTDSNKALVQKPKKKKKKNYNKEFQPELNMLKSLVADQNRFTNDLQKRFQNMVGPNTKDASPLNKTEVELASAIISSRQNSLGYLREIGTLKKTVADLYLRQAKQDAELNGSGGGIDTTDLTLLGSSIASKYDGSTGMTGSVTYGAGQFGQSPSFGGYTDTSQQVVSPQSPMPGSAIQSPNSTVNIAGMNIQSFDPATWDGPDDVEVDQNVLYENIPHEVVVEWNKATDEKRFKAIRTDNGEELPNYDVPTIDFSRVSINEKDMIMKGNFDEVYKVQAI